MSARKIRLRHVPLVTLAHAMPPNCGFYAVMQTHRETRRPTYSHRKRAVYVEVPSLLVFLLLATVQVDMIYGGMSA